MGGGVSRYKREYNRQMACGKAELGVSGDVSDGSQDQHHKPQTASHCVVEEGAENNLNPTTSSNSPAFKLDKRLQQTWIKTLDKKILLWYAVCGFCVLTITSYIILRRNGSNNFLSSTWIWDCFWSCNYKYKNARFLAYPTGQVGRGLAFLWC